MKSSLPALLLLLAACSPPGPEIDPDEHQTYLIYDYDSELGEYRLHESEILTFTDPAAVEGEVAFLRGGGNLVSTLGQPETREEFADALQVRGDNTPSAEYMLDGDLVVPYDFDTQMMVTLYHHLEHARSYFDSIGFDTERVGKMPVYYFPQTRLFGISLPILTDNAAYAFTLDAFIIPPTFLLNDDVPLSSNRGVIVHEYSHAIFNRIVHRDERVPDFIWDDSFSTAAETQIRSLDEGLADVFAGLAVQDPDFIAPSISNELFDIDRDLEIKRIYDDQLADEIVASAGIQGRNPYLLGSVVASALWATRDFVDDDVLGATILAAMNLVRSPTSSFGVEDFFNAFLDEMPQEDRETACEIFTERLELIENRLTCQ